MQNYPETILSYFKKEKYTEALSLSREFISKYEYFVPAYIFAVKAAYALNENSLAERIIKEMPLDLMDLKQRDELINHLKSYVLYGRNNNYESIIAKAKILGSEKSERYEELYETDNPEPMEEESNQSYPVNEQMAHILIAQGMIEPAREILEKLILLEPENAEHFKEILDKI